MITAAVLAVLAATAAVGFIFAPLERATSETSPPGQSQPRPMTGRAVAPTMTSEDSGRADGSTGCQSGSTQSARSIAVPSRAAESSRQVPRYRVPTP